MIPVVEQDGVRTDECPEVRSPWIALRCLRPRATIVLRTLLVADIAILLATGTLLAVFMEHPAGFIFAGCCWTLAALLASAPRITLWFARRRER